MTKTGLRKITTTRKKTIFASNENTTTFSLEETVLLPLRVCLLEIRKNDMTTRPTCQVRIFKMNGSGDDI